MPSVAKSNSWFVRITAPWSFIKDRIKTIQEWIDYDGMMVGFHIASQEHAHFAIKLKSQLQKQSFDVRFKKLFEVQGRSTYSSKVWDGDDKALSYLYHDEKGEVYNYMNLTEDKVKQLQEANTIVQKAVKQAKEKASHKIIDYVLEQAQEDWDAKDIGSCILRAVAKGQFHDPGDFMLERYINEIELKLCKSERDLNEVIEYRLRRLKRFS